MNRKEEIMRDGNLGSSSVLIGLVENSPIKAKNKSFPST
jgi:hypothetical protein